MHLDKRGPLYWSLSNINVAGCFRRVYRAIAQRLAYNASSVAAGELVAVGRECYG